MAAATWKIELGLGQAPTTASPTWTDVTAYTMVDGLGITRGVQTAEGELPDAGQASFRLKNGDRRFDPTYASGPYYGDLTPRCPVRVSVNPGGGFEVLFRGFMEGGWNLTPSDDGSYGWVDIVALDGLGWLHGVEAPGSAWEALVRSDPEVVHWFRPRKPTDNIVDEVSGRAARLVRVTEDYTSSCLVDGHDLPMAAQWEFDAPDGEEMMCWFRINREYGPMVQVEVSRPMYSQRMRPDPGYQRYRPTGEVAHYRAPTYVEKTATLDQTTYPLWPCAIWDGQGYLVYGAYISEESSGTIWDRLRVYTGKAVGDLRGYVDGPLATDSGSGWSNIDLANDQPHSIYTSTGGGALDGYAGDGWDVLGTIEAGVSLDDVEILRFGFPWWGAIDDVVVWSAYGPTSSVADLHAAGLTGWAEDTIGERIERWLNLSEWPDVGTVDTTTAAVGSPHTQHGTFLDICRQLAFSDLGHLHTLRTGEVQYHNREHWWSTTRAFDLSDDPADWNTGASPPVLPIGSGTAPIVFDDRRLVNEAVVTRPNSDSVVRARDTSSITAYGIKSQAFTIHAPSDAVARNFAEWRIHTGAQMRPRVASAVLHPRRLSGMGDVCATIELGDLVRLTRNGEDHDVHVVGITHQVAAGEWEMTLHLDGQFAGHGFGVWDTDNWDVALWAP